ncbi:YhfC family intramembrane metalloprotease [Ruminococcaceae bacterium OttesenSCG-928-D13]|nr:YhfC family intramembrane metalloprotease [Ruminococcaceae bacterium OttesenSCG-928-D13]
MLPRILGAVFNVLVALVLPLGALAVCLARKRYRHYVLPMLVGTLTFLLSQTFTRVPLLGWLGGQAWYVAFTTQTVPYALFLGLTAGLFEELGRFIAMRLMRRHRGFGSALAFGLGHGGVEAVWLVGINYLAVLLLYGGTLALYPWDQIFAAGFERLFAILAHIGFSVLVMRSVENKRPWGLVAAILLHAALDAGIVLLAQRVNSLWVVEGAIAAFSLGLFVYVLASRPKTAAPLEPESIIKTEVSHEENT